MRILHLLGAEEDTGGILSVIRALRAVTAQRDCEHFVWANRAYQETRQPALAYCYSRYLVAESPSHLKLLWGAVRALGELKALCRRERFDVLHAHSRGALLVAVGVAALWRRPALFTNHAYARRLGLYRWAARRPRLYTSVLTPNMARHYGLSLAAPRLAVISECCAERFFTEPLSAPRLQPAAGAAVRLAGLGNIVRWKNWHLLLAALERLAGPERARLEFHHWGPTPNTPDCRAYARELQQRARQLDGQPRGVFHGPSLAVAPLLREADWFVLPSTNEPCSVALIEALALGVPAIASASGGNVDIIQPGATGLLFEPDNAADLAQKLRQVLNGVPGLVSPAERRQSVRSRSASAVAGQFLKLYQQVAPPSQNSP
jgi:glycosyltransferase involved in cell wall biosynthesis